MSRTCPSRSNQSTVMPTNAQTPDTLNQKIDPHNAGHLSGRCARQLDWLDIRGLFALRSHLHFEADFLVFLQ